MSNEESTYQLPKIKTEMSDSAVFKTLLKMSKSGKLAGYKHISGERAAVVDAHGTPFDSDLVIQYSEEDICFSLKMRRKFPAIFMALLVVTVWPGLPLTDSFMFSLGWYERLMGESIETWMWYLPMTVLPIPFVWKSAIKKSRASARQHAIETIEKIQSTLKA
ncbi:MAG: hypothetical protein JKY43_00600 [Phycisphaerales bacterium]|nr:hypothetical protein [Phycisphaerales bacterium]